MKTNFKQGFVIQWIIAVIAIVLIGGGVYYLNNKNSITNTEELSSASPELESNNLVNDVSSNFNKSSIIISPKGGEKVVAGSNYIIKWNSDAIKTNTVNISYTMGPVMASIYSGYSYDIENKGSITWNVPLKIDDLSSGPIDKSYSAKITIKNSLDGKIVAQSDEFQIVPPISFEGSNPAQSIEEAKLLRAGINVLGALKSKDYVVLENLTSKDGISFNEYPHELDLTKSDVPRAEVSEIPNDKTVRVWGYTDGKGDEIKLTISEYIDKWIYNRDYYNATIRVVNKKANPDGNTPNNINEFAKGRNYVGFHIPSSEQYAGMDYSTLYLIFDNENGEYKVRGIVRDVWTI